MRVNKWAVRRLMAERGIDSQRELAEMVGVSQNTISTIINGGPFTSDTLTGLCRALQCTPNDILVGYPQQGEAENLARVAA